jgi:DUF1365 family protein
MTISALYAGAVTHQRLRPRKHRLRYRIFNVLLDLDELPALSRRLRLFSHDRFNLFSFHDRDHGAGEAGGLRAWIEAQLLAAGLNPDGGAIRVLCMPRILGHAFNPISVYWCHARDGALLAMLYEVNNTFGERHSYLMPAHGAEGPVRQTCRKSFYVSPFMAMDLTYRFRVTPPASDVVVAITASDAQGVMISTAFAGQREALTDRALLGRFLRMPLLGMKVVAAIHWEAARLWWKGMRLQARPAPPSNPVTYTPPLTSTP